MTFVAVCLGSVAAMEAVAWLMHRYLMHGPLWFLHESHHRPRAGWFERNDLFGIFFSVPSIVLIWYGTRGWPLLLAIGCGMTLYGFLYFVFHDVIVHRRLRIAWRPGGRYMQRIIRAHLIHHRTLTRDGAVSFGFLYAPDFHQP
jgi:beta-carotene 3-hydroxylase